MRCFLGFDIGTTNSKMALVSLTGNLIDQVDISHSVKHPQPGWAEQPSEMWWDEFVQASHILLARASSDIKIEGIGISGMAPTIVPLDENGREVRNSILYGIDTRASEEIGLISAMAPGKRLTMQSAAPKIYWLQRHEPENFARTATFVSTVGFLVQRLTGESTIDRETAAEFWPLYSEKTTQWDAEWCVRLHIPFRALPEILCADDIAGYVTRQAASQTGLEAGVPVVVGTMDALAERLSMGIVAPGDVAITYGTTMTVSTLGSVPISDDRLLCGSYPVPDVWRVAGAMNTSGSLVNWAASLAGVKPGTAPWNELLEQASGIKPGSDGLLVLPYFAGERTPIFDPDAVGMMMGLTLCHTSAHILRACMEATAYALLQNMEIISEYGCSFKRVIAAGGGTANRLWVQIVSDVTGVTQNVLESGRGAPLGVALLAMKAVGAIEGYDAIGRWVRFSDTVGPNPSNHERYSEYYACYEALYPNTKELLHRTKRLGCGQ